MNFGLPEGRNRHDPTYRILEIPPGCRSEPFLQALSALPEQIDWIRGMHVARSAAPNAAWDAALEVDFDTLEDVARYRDDPRHKKVSALCKSIRTDRVSIDIPL